MKYALTLSKEVIKELDRLDRKIEQRIQRRFDELTVAPYDPRITDKVITIPGQRYSRVGDRRIFFRVDDNAKTVDIIAIRPRGRAYPKGK
jgi:mRNA-degrading endonuclease RelE of RelBE toxin-antitoxin system